MRAVVTGGAGFIGSNLSAALLADGHDVVVFDDLSTGYPDNVPDGAGLVKADVADLAAVRDAVAGAEVVFHFAAQRAVARSVDDPLEANRVNVSGSLAVLKAAVDAGVRRVVYASSSSVYGGADQVPTPESAPLVPRSPYAVSKLAGEHYCRVFADLFRLETVALRLFNVFGPRQRPDSAYAAVIPLFLDALRSGRPVEVHGDGGQSRDFTYVDDVVAAAVAAATAPAEHCTGKAYNVACGQSHSLLDLLDALARIVGADPTRVHTSPRPGDVRRSHADITAARRDLGYEPKVLFADGLARTAEWFATR